MVRSILTAGVAEFQGEALGSRRALGLAERGADFACESTLSGRTLHAFLGRLTARVYESHIFYLWLPSVDRGNILGFSVLIRW